MAKKWVTKEQVKQAKEIDLLTYLRMFEPNNLKRFGNKTYCTVEHDSLKISEDGLWNWFSRGIGGKTALDYLIKVKDMSFVEAVLHLCNNPKVQSIEPRPVTKPKEKKPFKLPDAYTNNNRAFSYLYKRGISKNLIKYCIENKLIYESKKYHNVVFVGYGEDNKPRYAALRGTWICDNPFKGEVLSSDKHYSFSLKPIYNTESNKLIISESAIDILSVASLRYSNLDCHYLSTGGIYKPKENGEIKFPISLDKYLENNKSISKVILCLDNDDVGRNASRFIKDELEKRGYEVEDHPPTIGKDYNDMLMAKRAVREQELELQD